MQGIKCHPWQQARTKGTQEGSFLQTLGVTYLIKQS